MVKFNYWLMVVMISMQWVPPTEPRPVRLLTYIYLILRLEILQLRAGQAAAESIFGLNLLVEILISHEIDDFGEDIEEYNISSARTTIASSKFAYIDSGRGTPTIKTITLRNRP